MTTPNHLEESRFFRGLMYAALFCLPFWALAIVALEVIR